jgi:hypothetical protein
VYVELLYVELLCLRAGFSFFIFFLAAGVWGGGRNCFCHDC